MRILISAMLLASVAAVPVVAQDAPNMEHRSDHGEGGHHDQGGHGGNPGGQPQPQRADRPGGGNFVHQERPGGFQGENGGPRANGDRPITNAPVNRGDYHRPDGAAGHGNGDNGNWHGDHGWDGHNDGHNWNDGHNRNDGHNWSGNNDHRPPPGGWDRDHGRPGGQWNGGWRQDRRYDWQGWRNSHRDIYRGGGYRAPYGYGGYRRFEIGVRLPTVFFAQNYWIGNPDYYRLPPAYGPYRWVRYYNDALLIDIYSGQVVDAIPDFFW